VRTHGRSGTITAGCKCDQCREASRRKRALTRKRAEHKTPPAHGTLNAYQNYSCRCEPCRAAASKAYHAKKANA
jgi:hypothetical protein